GSDAGKGVIPPLLPPGPRAPAAPRPGWRSGPTASGPGRWSCSARCRRGTAARPTDPAPPSPGRRSGRSRSPSRGSRRAGGRLRRGLGGGLALAVPLALACLGLAVGALAGLGVGLGGLLVGLAAVVGFVEARPLEQDRRPRPEQPPQRLLVALRAHLQRLV